MSGANNILFIVTGSIAAYKACGAVSRLVQAGHTVRTVATPSALNFVGKATLEGLTGQPVASELWAEGRTMDHIALTRWADLVIVCPATAHTLNRLAAGLGEDLVGALFLAKDATKPWLMAPAMNPAMWNHPATVRSVAQLRSWGVQILAPKGGRTACGETGEGRLPEPDEIVAAVETALARPAQRLRVLITSGGTAEPVDGVRVLTNTSTGRTGALLAEHFTRIGHAVTLVRAERSAAAPYGVGETCFSSFADLDGLLGRCLGEERFDAVIHAAAVADFSIGSLVQNGATLAPGAKLDSRLPAQITLRPTAKLVEGLRARSRNEHVKIVAFKLTDGASPEEAHAAVSAMFSAARPDYVVHNDLAGRGADPDDFPATVNDSEGRAVLCATRRELAVTLERLLSSPTPYPYAPLS